MHLKIHYIFIVVIHQNFVPSFVMMKQIDQFERLLSAVYNFQSEWRF